MVVAAVISVAVALAVSVLAVLVVFLAAIALSVAFVAALAFAIGFLVVLVIFAAVVLAGPIVAFVLAAVFLGSALLGVALQGPRSHRVVARPEPAPALSEPVPAAYVEHDASPDGVAVPEQPAPASDQARGPLEPAGVQVELQRV